MNPTLTTTIEAAQEQLDPQFKALKAATGALKQAAKLAAEEKADAPQRPFSRTGRNRRRATAASGCQRSCARY